MNRERPGLDKIKAWINEGNKEQLPAQDNHSRSLIEERSPVEVNVIQGANEPLSMAEVQAVADDFLQVLNSYNPPNDSATDWTVKIALVDVAVDLYVVCESAVIAVELVDSAVAKVPHYAHTLSMHSHELKALADFETDLISVMISNIGIAKDKNEKPMELIRPISDILFGAYNMHFLKERFSEKLVYQLYEEGKVTNFKGSERFIFPWAISSDIGIKLHDIIAENNIERSLEVGLAFGLSALFICEAHEQKRSGHHTAIDPCQSVEFESIGLSQIEHANLNPYFRHLEYKDYEIFPKILEAKERYQFIFIDGLHMQDYVTLDFFYSDMLLDVGGFMAFDDCHAPGVSAAVAYFEHNRQYRFIPEYSVLRFRVYQKLAEDNRTIVSPNHHVDYSKKYYQLSGIKQPAAGSQQERISHQESPISVVGIDGLFPGDLSVEEYWAAIEQQTVLYGPYPEDFLLTRKDSGQAASLTGGMLSTAYDFDPVFFNISVAEAEIMDPQLRHMMMSVQRAIEDSGYTAGDLAAQNVGVFIGAEGSDYNDVHRNESFARNYILHQSGPSLANRISHHYDFRGPSEVINTMCSSGAVCLSRAVEALRNGTIDYAIVGAVKINFVDSIYGALEALNITSRSGRCYSFHQDSDGYVRSEGVVSLVLTRQDTAKTHKDHVYAHIRAVATNYNGRDGHSMFSPSKNAQKELIRSCLSAAELPISALTSFEAQGMGNNISDLVEYSVFTEVHDELSQADTEAGVEQSSALPAISTVKPILGHMECVSSLAALLKAILSFKNRTLYGIPSLTQDTVHNNLLAHQGAGLLLEHQPVAASTHMVVGLNSFGASGTNVHMILEQPDQPATDERDQDDCAKVLLLSGKTIGSLYKNVSQLCARLEADAADFPLARYLATMQLYRDHHEHKVAILLEQGAVASQIGQLHDRLQTYLQAEADDPLIRDNSNQGPYHYAASTVDEASTAASLLGLTDRWLAGEHADWQGLYATGLPHKTGRLPAYQFDTQRHHLTGEGSTGPSPKVRAGSVLDENISDFTQQAYLSKLTGHEAFLVDHQVNGQKVLPAVVYLEMARAAIMEAWPEAQSDQSLQLRDVVWPKPCFVAGPSTLKTALLPSQANGQSGMSLQFEISSEVGGVQHIHCQGSAWLDAAESAPHIEVAEIRDRTQKSGHSSEELYDQFNGMGVAYGPTHRCLGELNSNDREVLAYLHRSTDQAFSGLGLDPGLLDSALQSTLLLVLNDPNVQAAAALPFAVEEVVVNGTPGQDMLAWTRVAEDSNLQDEVVKFNVDVTDQAGRVVIGLKNFSVRSMTPVQTKNNHSVQSSTAVSNASNIPEAVSLIKNMLAEHLKMPTSQISVDKSFIEHGLDSILITQFTARLRNYFSGITSTLFFEVHNIQGLVNHLATHNAAELLAITVQGSAAEQVRQETVSQPDETAAVTSLFSQHNGVRFAHQRYMPEAQSQDDIAIVGLSGRYPNAADVNEFWTNLRDGVNCISEVPAERWDWRPNHHPERGRKDTIYTRWGGFIDDADKFDPLFFKLSPAEAERIDPQERIFLEAAYHAIEDAGHTPQTLSAKQQVGVFVGVMNAMYNTEPDHFSIANRTSYLFDFHGPSMAVDTACSSSLTAIHLAVESIKTGQSEAAVAGGVNLILDDHHYQRLSAMSALSSGNECKAFGANADGFIDAEGVGAVVLKSRRQAEKDGDHIYGLIKGTALNAGGKTAGYTVPCPKAQAALIKDVLHRSHIEPGQISYIETHGTGTELGDPIEIAGLSHAFSVLSDSTNKIPIGSVKSNIGHCESAAGIAGVTKILLQFKHNMLVPSLHAEKPNTEIDFANSPFQVQQELSPWTADGAQPRVAGVSSFGLGGANAHVLIEEFLPPTPATAQQQPAQDLVFLLSARTEEQLLTKAKDLLTYLASHQGVNLRSLSHTLQVGREHMDHRLAVIASDVDVLQTALQRYVSDEQITTPAFYGQGGETDELLSLFGSDEELQVAINRWLAGGQWSRLLPLWVKGLNLNWASLNADGPVQRISLPVYPFARERHWAKQKAGANSQTVSPVALHPLVQQNRSNLFQLAYESQFTGQESCLSDHQINGQKVLPAAAYLEMIHCAVADANGVTQSDMSLQIQDLVWQSACVPTPAHTVTVRLYPAAEQGLDFEVTSSLDSAEETVHCEGHAVILSDQATPKVDVDELQQHHNAQHHSQDEVYAGFAGMGVQLTGAHRGIRAIHQGDDQLFAELDLSHVLTAETQQDYWLHPGMLDSALQSMVGMLADLSATRGRATAVPYSVNQVNILAATEAHMYAWIKYARGPEHPLIFDVLLCDHRGRISVEFKELEVQELPATAAPQSNYQTLLASPHWTTTPVSDTAQVKSELALETDARQVLLAGLPKVDCAAVEAALANSTCQRLAGAHGEELSYEQVVLDLLKGLKTILAGLQGETVCLQVAVANSQPYHLLAGLQGLLKTAETENPQLSTQLVFVDAHSNAEALVKALKLGTESAPYGTVAVIDERLSRPVWDLFNSPVHDTNKLFHDHGAYLITGGLGGLGQLFAEEIMTQTNQAQVVLTGRQAQADLPDNLRQHQHRISYQSLSLTSLDEALTVIETIEKESGPIKGIIHAAGMVSDDFIIKHHAEDVKRVLQPKVAGLQMLDEASKHCDLDFFVLFSSLAAVFGNAGQADYAAANGYLNEFARTRHDQVQAGERRGKTVSINWPYWQSGGMRLTDQQAEVLLHNAGIAAMPVAEGMQAFHHGLTMPGHQLLVMHGDESLMKSSLEALNEPQQLAVTTATQTDLDPTIDEPSVMAFFIQVLSDVLKLPAHQIKPQASFETYGMDSILAMDLTNTLQKTFGPLPKTLFFEHQSTQALVAFFMDKYPEKLAQLTTTEAVKTVKTTSAARRIRPLVQSRELVRSQSPRNEHSNHDIAVIGMSGQYPMADDITAFWDNLKQGKDCVAEIPASRWDADSYFDPRKNIPGKSYSKWGGFLDGIDLFDPLFFNISPKEAALLDPQERLFLQNTWCAIEDAGYDKHVFRQQTVGVYVGVMWGHYELYGHDTALAGQPVAPSSSFGSIANRVSYFFDLNGPSMALDTMCSSSLTAIHLACEDLRHGHVDAAIAGGVNASIHPQKYLVLSQGNFAATDGKCRSFGEGGDGYVPGEGVGVLILKSLAQAVHDNDQIHGVIKATSINHGGKTHGYTVPNPTQQTALINQALDKAGIDPATIGYIETHGTGTALGDPIEVAGLNHAFAEHFKKPQTCPIGSVKSNIGHLESAAGVAAITKSLLQLKHQQLVPSLHATSSNPNIDFDSSPFYVQTTLAEWPAQGDQPRRIGVSSFGAGGANGHVILEEYRATQDQRGMFDDTGPQVFVLSARDPAGLIRYAEKMQAFLQTADDDLFHEIIYTAQIGRTAMEHRLAILVMDKADLQSQLSQWLAVQKSADHETISHNRATWFEGHRKALEDGTAELLDGAAGDAYLNVILKTRDFSKLARLWAKGASVEWAQLYQHQRPVKTSLPTYPFCLERIWLPMGLPQPAQAAPVEPPNQPHEALCFTADWTHTVAIEYDSSQLQGPILVLTDHKLQSLEQEQHKALVQVIMDDWFAHMSANSWSIDGRENNDYERLLDAVCTDRNQAIQIVYLMPENVHDEATDGCFSATTAETVFRTLLSLCQTLSKRKSPVSVKLLCAYVEATEQASAAGAAMAAFLKTAVLENPLLSAKTLALRGETAAWDEASMLSLCCTELLTIGAGVEELRYESAGQRYTRVLSEVDLVSLQNNRSMFKQQGNYLITGGLGSLGYLVATYLAQNHQANLVLLGRSAPETQQQQQLQKLREHGVQVVYEQVDVGDAHALKLAIESAESELSGRINGVINSAGAIDDAFLIHKEPAQAQAVMHSKLAGIINLDQVTRHHQLDVFVVFSSLAGETGNVGQCDYAFANRFADVLVHNRQQLAGQGLRHGNSVAMAWPFWRDGGMQISTETQQNIQQSTGLVPLPTEAGLALMETMLSSGLDYALPVFGDAQRLRATLLNPKAGPGRVATDHKADMPATKSLQQDTERYLQQLIGAEINLEPGRVDVGEHFDHYGIDSVMIGKLNATLEQDLGGLPKTLFFDNLNIEELTATLLDLVPEQLSQYLAGSDQQNRSVAPVDWQQAQSMGVRTQANNAPVFQNNKLNENNDMHEHVQAIAVIGLHGRYPGADDLDTFWEQIKAGQDLVAEVPANRWSHEAWFAADPAQAEAGKIYCQWGGFLADVDLFEHEFFNISHHEAKLMDPQERLFLMSAWSAMENAGYTRDELQSCAPKGKSADVGVFVGVTTNTYNLLAHEAWENGDLLTPSAMPWSIANRISYLLNLNGPSMPVDTACSSSLVAINLACESLRRGECQMALAGGVNLYLHPAKYLSMCQKRMLSQDGKCRSFGAGDNGFVPAEGVGSVLLKPLSKAERDGDHIHCLILGGAHDHSGRSNGYSTPNPVAQARVIDQALQAANCAPETINYVEGHGTGTLLGDGLEVAALNQVLNAAGQVQPRMLGSVKSNMGHAESAAGIAGISKVIMQMHHQQVAPSLHSSELNPDIDFAATGFKVPQSLTGWPTPGHHSHRALVNSFGAGGVNACVVLEAYQADHSTQSISMTDNLFVLSAESPAQLHEYAGLMKSYILAHPEADFHALCYTTQVGREAMQHRLIIQACSLPDLLDKLSMWLADNGAQVPQLKTAVLDHKPGKRRMDETLKTRMHDLASNHQWDGLIEAWLSGLPVQWRALYAEGMPAKLALPSYPFRGERCWITEANHSRAVPALAKQSAMDIGLHPLVTANTSTLNEVSFVSRLSSTAYYATDHLINESCVFPGAAYLEMACVAGNLAGQRKVTRLRDIIWTHPLVFNGDEIELHTILRSAGDDTEFRMVSQTDSYETQLHAEGRLMYGQPALHTRHNTLDLLALQNQCHEVVEAEAFYRQFADLGFTYKPSFQSVERVYVGADYCLAHLILPAHLQAEADQYILHPALLDGVLQSVSALISGADVGDIFVPFAVDEIELLRPLTRSCFVHVKCAAEDQAKNQQFNRYQMLVLSESGQVLMNIKNFYLRSMGLEHKEADDQAAVNSSTVGE